MCKGTGRWGRGRRREPPSSWSKLRDRTRGTKRARLRDVDQAEGPSAGPHRNVVRDGFPRRRRLGRTGRPIPSDCIVRDGILALHLPHHVSALVPKQRAWIPKKRLAEGVRGVVLVLVAQSKERLVAFPQRPRSVEDDAPKGRDGRPFGRRRGGRSCRILQEKDAGRLFRGWPAGAAGATRSIRRSQLPTSASLREKPCLLDHRNDCPRAPSEGHGGSGQWKANRKASRTVGK